MDSLLLIKNLIKDKDIATIAPTSKSVINEMFKKINFKKDLTIIEYGPGTGVITKALLNNISSASKIIAIEKNRQMCSEAMKIRDKRLKILKGNVKNLIKEVKKITNGKKADYVISGIPFSMIEKKQRIEIVHQTKNILSKNGKFILYQFLPLMKKYLDKEFEDVSLSFKLANIPPLFIIAASK